LPAVNTPLVKPPVVPLRRLEAPARAQGVTYEFQSGVKHLPKAVDYSFKALTLEQFASMAPDTAGSLPSTSPSIGPGVNLPNIGLPGGAALPSAGQSGNASPGVNLPNIGLPGGAALPSAGQSGNASQNKFDLDNIDGIKYAPGSKILSVPRTAASSFTPKMNEIYVDEEMGTVFRVVDNMGTDAAGDFQHVVETPQLTDVFESYSIPEQDIYLTTGNIAYIAPELELSPESGMPKNYVAKAGGTTVYENSYIKCNVEGNKHILEFKKGIVLFEYPSKAEKEQAEEDKKEAEKRKFEGDWWEKDQSTDLRGVENESSLSVAVKVKGGHVTLTDPRVHTYFDLNKWTSHMEAELGFIAEAEADITLEGDLTFNKTIEKCVYGYEVDLGAVPGKEKGNKAFVGIFVVLGIDGKIHVEVRTVTNGTAEAGFAYSAYGYGLIPYYVGPYQKFNPKSFDMSFTVDGEINTTLACVPQVGLIIWGTELGVLQVWLGFKANAKFHAEGGTGQDFQAEGSIDLKAFGELVGYLLGSRYSIFYIDFPLYSGAWKVGQEVSGSGGSGVREVPPYIMATADAYTNAVEGKVAFSTAGKTEDNKAEAEYMSDGAVLNSKLKPYGNQPVDIEVYDKWKSLKFIRTVTTDAEGKFKAQFTGAQNILTLDWVYINVPKRTRMVEKQMWTPAGTITYEVEEDVTPVIEVNNTKFKVVGKSGDIRPTVPFSRLDFNVDTFNDVITGWVSGNYTGPVKIGGLIPNSNATVNAQAVNGLFTLSYPIDQNVYNVHAFVDFEDCWFPYPSGVTRQRNLDALTLSVFNDFKPAEALQENGNAGSNGITIGKGVDKNISLPSSITNAQNRLSELLSELTSKDVSGRKFVKPTKVTGTIVNTGDMGWVEKQGDDYVRTAPVSPLRHYDGNVTITAISVQSALEAMFEKLKGPHDNWVPRPRPEPPWTATTKSQQAMHLRVKKDANAPDGIRIEQIPTSSGRFEFDKPDVVAYYIEIEYEGLTKKYTYNPYTYHYNNNQESVEDFLGPFIQAVTPVTQEKVDAVINPADVTSQWQGSWVTNVGIMQLTQKGTAVSGNIMQGATAVPLQGTVTNGIFKGSYGNNMSFEMNISADGKTINFKNFGAAGSLRGLNGTTAGRK